MKNQWFVAAALLLAPCLKAQRTDLDRYSFSVAYRDLPRLPIDSSYHTYEFHWDAGPLTRVSVGKEDPGQAMEIEGWRRLSSHAHISVDLFMEDIYIVKTDIAEREELKKDKNGNIVERKIWYAPLLTYNYAATVNVKDYRGRSLQQYNLANREQQQQFKGMEYPSRSAASNILLNMMLVSTQISRDVLIKNINQLSYNLTDQYGYAERRVGDMVWVLDSRKHPEYDRFRANWAIIKNGLFKLHPDEPADEISKEVKPAIDYFEKLKRQYSSRSKSDRKLRYAACYILAKLYYYLDDPDRAARQATELVMNDYDSRDGQQIESMAIALKQKFIQNKRNTRHFPMDIYTMEGP